MSKRNYILSCKYPTLLVSISTVISIFISSGSFQKIRSVNTLRVVKKIAIVHTDFRIYWPARLLALSAYLSQRGVELTVIEISGKGSPYSFDCSANNTIIKWECLFKDLPMEQIAAADAVRAVLK